MLVWGLIEEEQDVAELEARELSDGEAYCDIEVVTRVWDMGCALEWDVDVDAMEVVEAMDRLELKRDPCSLESGVWVEQVRNRERKPACSLRGQVLCDAGRVEEREAADEAKGATEETRAAAAGVRALISVREADGSMVEDTARGAGVPGWECPRRWVGRVARAPESVV